MEAHQRLETAPWKEEEGGGGEVAARVDRNVVVTAAGLQESHHLDLRLGISLKGFEDVGCGGITSTVGGPSAAKGGGVHTLAGAGAGSFCVGGAPVPQQQKLGRVCGGPLGAKRWFCETTGGSFADPWSLAARQESAVLEQRTLAYRRNVDPTATSHTVVPRAPIPTTVVGWPPVRAFRKNLVAPLVHPNPEMDVKKDLKKTKPSEEDMAPLKPHTKSNLFVKVNMEGYNVGRKIDLMAHSSYQSLSCALQKMFHNFLTVGHSNNSNSDAQDEPIPTNYILLYEDNEGDRLLVGDVPWEMFINSVKRLYIAHGSKDPKRVEERAAENKKSKQFEDEVKAKG
ncbi:hypothetical protein Taro_039367 [Colocasia esculenta]|uniref:Auxin-responsive protein n=1 Tax=Colocasia esculenta TaxID=4460 RepID=A0A843WRC8_COLES|nr:hypothetical protein [Colocasia esculenta]